jgi:hypothetical protein
MLFTIRDVSACLRRFCITCFTFYFMNSTFTTWTWPYHLKWNLFWRLGVSHSVKWLSNRLDDETSIRGRGMHFVSSSSRRYRSEVHLASYQMDAKFKNAWSYTYTSPFITAWAGIAQCYSAGLRAWWSDVRVPVGARNFPPHHRIQTGYGAHPASYPMGSTGSFLGDKAAVAWRWPLTSI